MKIGISSYPLHTIREADKHLYPTRCNHCNRDLYQVGKLVRDAGFEYCEMSGLGDIMFCLSGYAGNDYIGECTRIGEYYNKIGLKVDKVHAGFTIDRNKHDWKPLLDDAIKCIDKTVAIGSNLLVIHADVYTCEYGKYNEKDAFKTTYEYVAPIVEKAKKCGVNIAIENLFEEGQANTRLRYTSTAEDLIEIIDAFGDPCVTCCWDFGHAAAAFGDDMVNQMKKLGNRITCTHIHDNKSTGPATMHIYNYLKDLHLPIFYGKINWEENIRALKDLGFDGVYNLELGDLNFPEALLLDNLKMIYKNSRYMLENY